MLNRKELLEGSVIACLSFCSFFCNFISIIKWTSRATDTFWPGPSLSLYLPFDLIFLCGTFSDVCVRVCIFLYTVLLPDSLFVGRMSAGLERGSGGSLRSFPPLLLLFRDLPSFSLALGIIADLQPHSAPPGRVGQCCSRHIYRPLLLTPSSLAYPLSRFYQSHERRGATKRFLHVILGRGQVGHRSVWALVLNFGSRGQLSFVVILFGF